MPVKQIRWIPLLILAGLWACGQTKDETAVREAVNGYHQAVRSGDPQAVLPHLARAHREELTGPNARQTLTLIASLLPPEVTLGAVELRGDAAEVTLTALVEGRSMTGKARLVREEGTWRLEKESWSMDMTSAPLFLPSVDIHPFLGPKDAPPQPVRVLAGHAGEVSCLAFTPDTRFLLSASYGDYSIRVWDPATGREMTGARTRERPTALAVSPDGRFAYTADAANTITAWPLEEGVLGSPEPIASDAGPALAVSADGRWLVTAGYDRPVILWDLSGRTRIRELKGKPHRRAAAFSRDGSRLAVGGDGDILDLWTTRDWDHDSVRIRKVTDGSGIAALDFSPDGSRLATGHTDSSIVILDVGKRKELHNFYVPDAATTSVRFSPDGALLATAQNDRSVYLWNTAGASRRAKLSRHSQCPLALAFSPDGTLLASGGEDRLIVLWGRGAPAPAPPEREETVPPEARAPVRVKVEGRQNLVKNPSAALGTAHWRPEGQAGTEPGPSGDPMFVLRFAGELRQDIRLPGTPRGGTLWERFTDLFRPTPRPRPEWALIIARTAGDRLQAEDDITGIPYLWGYFVNGRREGRIDMYLTEEGEWPRSGEPPGTWDKSWKVFRIPPTSGSLHLWLQQASGRSPQTGSAARFDDVGVFLFDSREEAEAFAERY